MALDRAEKLPGNGICKERNVWNKLRARHYSFLILLAIVTIETSAIAIDRFINREFDTAFAIESNFENNPFVFEVENRVADSSSLEQQFVEATNTNETVAEKVQRPTVKSEQSSSREVAKADVKKDNGARFASYVIKPGDSLSTIAQMFGSSVERIKAANDISSRHRIMAGQEINVPLSAAEMVYTVKPGDSLSRIAGRFGLTIQGLIEENNLKTHRLVADQKLRIPARKTDRNTPALIPSRSASDGALELVRSSQLQRVENNNRLQLTPAPKLQVAQAPAKKSEVALKTNADKKPVATKQEVAKAKTEAIVEPEKQKKSQEVAQEKEDEIPSEPFTYQVVRGDSLLKIAHKYDTTAAQIQHDNDLNGTMVRIGQRLKINPGKKRYRVVRTEEDRPSARIENHTVRRGENLTVIARRYNSTISAIKNENNMSGTMVRAGQTLRVPTNQRQGPTWRMPTRGRLSDRFGYRNHPIHNRRMFHAGIDVAAPRGTSIVAARAGRVTFSGRRAGYGNMVIIDHGNGYTTRYAHCSTLIARKGQRVSAGELIARVGATGLATGNHLHFEIRKNGTPKDPMAYVR